MKLPRQIRLLPLLVGVATLAFAVRVGDVYTQAMALTATAHAEEKAAEKEPEKAPEPSAATPPSDDKLVSKDEKPAPADPAKAPAKKEGAGDIDLPGTDWQDASETDLDYSTVRKEIYQDLMQRRQALDAREKELAKRDALIKAAEGELDKKYQELTGIRSEIQDLLKKQSEEEQARINSLVKIYEGMKAKDAARIFNTLDMDVLLEVVSKMSERKSAPIIAEMDDERARSLTLFLAEQKKLPELPQNMGSSTAPLP